MLDGSAKQVRERYLKCIEFQHIKIKVSCDGIEVLPVEARAVISYVDNLTEK